MTTTTTTVIFMKTAITVNQSQSFINHLWRIAVTEESSSALRETLTAVQPVAMQRAEGLPNSFKIVQAKGKQP